MPRGATRQFDRSEVLDRAMHLFWERGYEATGLADLLDRMGIGRQSLYDTFGDKRSLFLEALDHYAQSRLGLIRDQLDAPGSPLRNIRRVLNMYERQFTSGRCAGCLIVNTMAESGGPEAQPGGEDRRIEALLKRQMKNLVSMFRAAFEQARQDGEIHDDADTLALARSMCALTWSLALMGRARAGKPMIRDTIRMHWRIIQSVQA